MLQKIQEEIKLMLNDLNENYKSKFKIVDSIQFTNSSLLKHIKLNKKILDEFQKKYMQLISKPSVIFYIMDKTYEEVANIMICKNCSLKINRFLNTISGFTIFCGARCAQSSNITLEKRKKTVSEQTSEFKELVKERIKQTNLEKYGVKNPSQSKIIKEKSKQTNLEKYGVENPFQSELVKEKSKQTKLEKYGDENFLNKEKSKQTKLEKYGDINYNNRNLAKQTSMERYGVDSFSKHESFKGIVEKSNLEKYGVTHVMLLEEYKEIFKKSNLEKYGVEFPAQLKIINDKNKITSLAKYGVEFHNQQQFTNYDNYNEEFIRLNFIKDGYFLLNEFCEYFNCSETHARVSKHNFNIEETKKQENFKTQQKMYEWLLSLNIDANNNNKTIISPKELDIYLPDHKLAIEYDGLMYHSFGKNSWSALNNHNKENENKYNHLNKTEECEKHGIQLLHIFENEWLEKEDLWKSVIMSKLGLNDKIYARKCQIKEVSNHDSNIFLVENHLQGECVASIRLGLFYDEQLVSIMTFSKSRYNLSYEYELIRFCSLRGLTIVGGASKLFAYFVKNFKPKSVISYANRRWSNGNLYKQIGFDEVRKTTPNYFYFEKIEYQLKSRLAFQKHKLQKILAVYNEELTETENMYDNGYRKIYDSGNIVFEWKNNV